MRYRCCNSKPNTESVRQVLHNRWSQISESHLLASKGSITSSLHLRLSDGALNIKLEQESDRSYLFHDMYLSDQPQGIFKKDIILSIILKWGVCSEKPLGKNKGFKHMALIFEGKIFKDGMLKDTSTQETA